MPALSLEKLRQRLELCSVWMDQLESASSERMINVAKTMYSQIRDVYRDVVEFKKQNGDTGLAELLKISNGVYNLIAKMSRDFSRPLPEENSFDYKQHIKSKILGGETITVVKQNIIYRGTYEMNVDGNVTYHENEFLLLKQVGATAEEMRAVHLIKKVFDGELLSAKGIFNPDIPYHTAEDAPREVKAERPRMEVINLEFSDTR
jgi:hypothetical protein